MGRFGDRDILERTEEYSLRAIKLFRYLRKRRNEDEEGWIMGRQFLRAGTSIGANLVEADGAETKKDFVHKCRVSLKEARECRYWLRIFVRAGLIDDRRLAGLLDETEQLVSILVAIIVKTAGMKGDS